MSWDNPNYNIAEISQNTEKSPGDLRWLDAIQTPMKNHQQSLTQVKDLQSKNDLKKTIGFLTLK